MQVILDDFDEAFEVANAKNYDQVWIFNTSYEGKWCQSWKRSGLSDKPNVWDVIYNPDLQEVDMDEQPTRSNVISFMEVLNGKKNT